jgi:hypothetical protein
MGKDSNKKSKKDKSLPLDSSAVQDEDSTNYHLRDESPSSNQNNNTDNNISEDYQEEEGEIPIQYGFNGKPLIKFDRGQSIFVSNQRKERLEAGTFIDYDKIIKFVQQVKREDFEENIESLIDPIVWI